LEITIKLAGLFRIERFKEAAREYPTGTRVEEVVAALQLPEHLLGIILINGVHASAQDVLSPGDTLQLLPLLGGG